MSGSRDRGRKSTVTDDSGMGPKRRRPERDSRIDDSGMGPKRRRPMPRPISRRRLEDERRRVPRRR